MVAHVANYSTTKYTEARVLVTLVGLENIARVSPHCLMLSQVRLSVLLSCCLAKVAFSCLMRTGLCQQLCHWHFTVWPFNSLTSKLMVTRYA